MKSKEFVLEDQTTFIVTKRSSSRHMRISIRSNGEVNVSIPSYVPYAAAIAFVKSRKNWIDSHRPEIKIYTNGIQVGKSHHLFIQPSYVDKISSRIKDTEATLLYPKGLELQNKVVQKAAQNLAAKALKIQAKSLLPIRAAKLAQQYGFSYQDIKFRNLKNRWGSCDSKKVITFNIYLMELPWDLIDYVIIHELNHTKYLNHSPDFWANMESLLPNVKELRKQIKSHKART